MSDSMRRLSVGQTCRCSVSFWSLLLPLAREVGVFREHEDGEGEVVKAGS